MIIQPTSIAAASALAQRALLVAPGATAAAPTSATPTAEASTAEAGENDLMAGVDISRPFDVIPNFLTNVAERLSGKHDPRVGRALAQILLAGQQVVQAGLRSMAQGSGAIATGSSLLGKVLPVVGIATGSLQIWRGWNELKSHDEGLLSIIHSKTARTGILQVIAGAMLFLPGVGAALGGSLLRVAAAANEMDEFKSLDWETVPIESRGEKAARIAHPFDRTPTNPDDPVVPREQDRDMFEQVVDWAQDHLMPSTATA